MLFFYTGSPVAKLGLPEDPAVTVESVSGDKSDVPQAVLTTPSHSSTAAQSKLFAFPTFTLYEVTVTSEIFQL